MTEDVRDELRAYFARAIGSPPPGARERILRGLVERAPDRSHGPRLRGAAAGALLLTALIVATLLSLRAASLVPSTQPGRQGDAPSPRSGAAAAYDAARRVLLLFGGTGDGRTALSDTWAWDGTSWTHLHPATAPPPVANPVMASDAAHSTLVLYGAAGSTWTWDGTTWRSHPGAPPLDASAVMAYDPATRGVLLYLAPTGGEHQTWRWDGAGWTRLAPRTTPDIVMGTMVFDGRRILLVGAPFGFVQGQAVTQTWAWDGADWSLLAPALRLPLSVQTGAAYDPARSQVVALAGGETWLWDGTTWRRVHPAHQPPARLGAAMATDTRSSAVVMYGGHSAAGAALGDLWIWDGTDWTQREETKR
jgi:hypothetical protein